MAGSVNSVLINQWVLTPKMLFMSSLSHLRMHEMARKGVSGLRAVMLPSQNMKFPFGFIVYRKRKEENRAPF